MGRLYMLAVWGVCCGAAVVRRTSRTLAMRPTMRARVLSVRPAARPCLRPYCSYGVCDVACARACVCARAHVGVGERVWSCVCLRARAHAWAILVRAGVG